MGSFITTRQTPRELGIAVTDLLRKEFEVSEIVGPEQVRGGVWIASADQLDELADKCDLVVVTLGD